MRYFQIFAPLFLSIHLLAQIPGNISSQEPKITIKNAILAKVNGKTISLIDVMKKMDMHLHKNFPHLEDSVEARFQFYTTSWQHVLKDMINSQLILSDAEDKGIKLEDAEIRKELEKKFGPNILLSLDKINLSYEDAWEMTKEEMLIQRMSWYRVNSKAFQTVTPEVIKKEFLKFCKENPPKKQWKYEMISIRSAEEEASQMLANKVASFLVTNNDMTALAEHIKTFQTSLPGCDVQISKSYTVDDTELSDLYKSVLTKMEKDTFSEPILIKNKNSYCYRLFHLQDILEENPPLLENMYNKLEDTALRNIITEESDKYIEKLRKYYNYSQQEIALSDNFTPFSIE